jgi:hypothetical protein
MPRTDACKIHLRPLDHWLHAHRGRSALYEGSISFALLYAPELGPLPLRKCGGPHDMQAIHVAFERLQRTIGSDSV